MAAGLAIITTEGTGCAEVVGDAGLLIPAKNPQAITGAIRQLIDDPDLRRRLGAAARRRIEENFTWTAVTNRYVEEYARHVPPNGRISLRTSRVAASAAPAALGAAAAGLVFQQLI